VPVNLAGQTNPESIAGDLRGTPAQMLAPTVGHAPAPLDCQLGAWLSIGPPSMILRLGAANVGGFCLYVFLYRRDGGSLPRGATFVPLAKPTDWMK